MIRLILAPAAVAVAALLSVDSAFAGNVGNAGFESPIAAAPAPFVGRWEPFSLDGDNVTGEDTAQTSTANPRTGAASLELFIGNLANSFAGAFQDVPFDASAAGTGALGYFTGFHALQGNPGGSEIRIEWRDSIADTEVARIPNVTVSPAGSTYEPFSVSGVIPSGADTARIVYAIQSFGGVLDQTVFVDDVDFQIPEPSTVCLTALAGVALVGIRRRS